MDCSLFKAANVPQDTFGSCLQRMAVLVWRRNSQRQVDKKKNKPQLKPPRDKLTQVLDFAFNFFPFLPLPAQLVCVQLFTVPLKNTCLGLGPGTKPAVLESFRYESKTASRSWWATMLPLDPCSSALTKSLFIISSFTREYSC